MKMKRLRLQVIGLVLLSFLTDVDVSVDESSEANEGCIQYISWGVLVALFLTIFVWTARFLHCQNQSVQLCLICIYVCSTSAHRDFRYEYIRYKRNTFTLKTVLLGWQDLTLWSDLTLLNTTMSKKSTFTRFFLVEKFVLSMIIPIFALSVLAKPLNNAQIVRGVFLFMHSWLILFPLQNGLNLQKISLICLNREVCRFVTGIKPYNILTISVIIGYLLTCTHCWRCPRQHICTRMVPLSNRWWCFIALTRNCDCSCSTR